MAAAVPKWLESAQGDLTASKTDEQKEKTKTKNRKRYEARKRRIARKREAKMAKLRMAMEEKIDKMQVDTRELIQEEKERSKRFLSLARKYYGMWKTLNEKCRENSVWKLQRSQVQYSKSNVSFCFAPGANTNSIQLLALNRAPGSLTVPGSLLTAISLIFDKSDAVKVKCRFHASSTTDSLHKNR